MKAQKAAEKNNEKTEQAAMSEKNDTLVQVEHLKNISRSKV